MKSRQNKFFLSVFILCVALILPGLDINAQTVTRSKVWTAGNTFKRDVFIKNYGQFNNWINSKDTIAYAENNSEKIFFLPTGVIYRLDVVEKEEEPQTVPGNDDADELPKGKIHSYYIKMIWEGCNANAKLEASEESQGYYTFGEEGFEKIKAKGYKKIIYKNLYPGIDAEYTIPDASTSLSMKGGIKYKLIVNAGANLNEVKMNYSGDIESLLTDSLGNIQIMTPAGTIIDHAPLSFYKENNASISSEFAISDHTVLFKLNGNIDIHQSIIIDPWTLFPATLTANNDAYDVAKDDYDNIYITGGSAAYNLAKYAADGTFLWNYAIPTSFWTASGHGYSEMCVLPPHGSILLGEPINIVGPRIMKVNNDGTLAFISANLTGISSTYNYEIWVMFYNRCTGQLMGFGGGPFMDVNLQQVADTMLTTSIINNFDGYGGFDNDIASAIMDYNGDFYALVSSSVNPAANHLFKSLISAGYNPPPAFDVLTGYKFDETTNNGIQGFTGGETVRANALALNTNYLFSYDGDTLIAWDKNSGAILGEIGVDPSYLGGYKRGHEGIVVDECNNIYVGGFLKVHHFTFNGSSFAVLPPITSTITGQVYDLAINENTGILAVCGADFLSTVQINSCSNQGLTLTTSGNCLDTLTLTVSGGTPPYNYQWSNGSTSNTISGSPGIYTVTVTDNSCIILNSTGSAEICEPPATLNIPNVFTPNGDNKNDVFEIIYDGKESYNLLIFNRWGKMVYSTKNKDQHWNGKFTNGKDAADGVYYYVLDIGDKNYHGTVTLLR